MSNRPLRSSPVSSRRAWGSVRRLSTGTMCRRRTTSKPPFSASARSGPPAADKMVTEYLFGSSAMAPRSATPPAPAMKRVTTTATRSNLETVRVRRDQRCGDGGGHPGEAGQECSEVLAYEVAAIEGRRLDQPIKGYVEVYRGSRRSRGPDARMFGVQALLGLAEERLIQLFTAAQTGEADLEVSFSQVELGRVVVDEIDDSNRFAHVEHECLSELRHAGRLNDEAHRLFDGHEESRHVWVRDRDCFTVLDLFREHGQKGAAAAEHVAEAD